MPRIELLLATIVLLFFGLSGSATAQGPTGQRPTINIGDAWTYTLRNSQKNTPDSQFTITVNNLGAGQIVANWENPVLGDSGTLLFDQDLNLVENKRTSGLIIYRATPAFPGYQWPLYVGETWQRGFQYTVQGGGVQYQATLTPQVVGLEKVTVPAGTFDAYKINQTLEYMAFNGTNSWGGSQKTVLWYAPQTKSLVKSEITDFGPRAAVGTTVRELLSYHIK